jgi:hypothetical protein
MSFTPGPWRLSTLDLADIVTDGHPRVYVATTDPARGDIPDAVVEANVRLIAAAPDLYEACRALVAGFGLGPDMEDKDDDPDIVQGRAAIAKAEGRS